MKHFGNRRSLGLANILSRKHLIGKVMCLNDIEVVKRNVRQTQPSQTNRQSRTDAATADNMDTSLRTLVRIKELEAL